MTCTLLLVDDVDTVVTRASPAWLREALDARDRGASADITATDCLCEVVVAYGKMLFCQLFKTRHEKWC